MKRTAMQHTKLKRLVRVLQIPQYAAVGILESLWHLTARETPTGNIGRLSNEDIADWIGWEGKPELLMAGLIAAGWVDENDVDRLVVHDWLEHADDAVKKQLERSGVIEGKAPGMSIYFIRGLSSGMIKIGITEGSVPHRLKQLQTGSPEKLELLGFIKGNRNTEIDLHKQFASCRATGEWFAPEPELLRHISAAIGKECLPLSAVVSLPEPLPEPEPKNKNKQKPSRDKHESDPRHTGFKAAVMAYGAYKRVKLSWDESEAKQLSLLLKSAPDLTLQEFQACLNHRARSPGTPHGERPRLWLPNILRYQQGPLNPFNRTEETHATHGSKFERSQASTQRVLNDLLGGDVDFPTTSGGRTLEAGTGV